MKIEVDEHGTTVLKEVFNPIKFESADGEILHIMIRDSGFELYYNNVFYEMKENKVRTISINK